MPDRAPTVVPSGDPRGPGILVVLEHGGTRPPGHFYVRRLPWSIEHLMASTHSSEQPLVPVFPRNLARLRRLESIWEALHKYPEAEFMLDDAYSVIAELGPDEMVLLLRDPWESYISVDIEHGGLRDTLYSRVRELIAEEDPNDSVPWSPLLDAAATWSEVHEKADADASGPLIPPDDLKVHLDELGEWARSHTEGNLYPYAQTLSSPAAQFEVMRGAPHLEQEGLKDLANSLLGGAGGVINAALIGGVLANSELPARFREDVAYDLLSMGGVTGVIEQSWTKEGRQGGTVRQVVLRTRPLFKGIAKLLQDREERPDGFAPRSSDGRIVERLLGLGYPWRVLALAHPDFNEQEPRHISVLANTLPGRDRRLYIDALEPEAERITKDLLTCSREAHRIAERAIEEGVVPAELRDPSYPKSRPSDPSHPKDLPVVYWFKEGTPPARAVEGAFHEVGNALLGSSNGYTEVVLDGILNAMEDLGEKPYGEDLDTEALFYFPFYISTALLEDGVSESQVLRILEMDPTTESARSFAEDPGVIQSPTVWRSLFESRDPTVLQTLAGHYESPERLRMLLRALHETSSHDRVAEVLASDLAPDWVAQLDLPPELVAGALGVADKRIRGRLIEMLDRLKLSDEPQADVRDANSRGRRGRRV